MFYNSFEGSRSFLALLYFSFHCNLLVSKHNLWPGHSVFSCSWQLNHIESYWIILNQMIPPLFFTKMLLVTALSYSDKLTNATKFMLLHKLLDVPFHWYFNNRYMNLKCWAECEQYNWSISFKSNKLFILAISQHQTQLQE